MKSRRGIHVYGCRLSGLSAAFLHMSNIEIVRMGGLYFMGYARGSYIRFGWPQCSVTYKEEG